VPIVLDYGYYSRISPKHLAEVLVRNGVTVDLIQRIAPEYAPTDARPLTAHLAEIIAQSDQPRAYFGRWLYQVEPAVLDPHMWINRSKQQWETVKERAYPTLREQSRLSRLYPDYDEVIFPQRIETYTFTI